MKKLKLCMVFVFTIGLFVSVNAQCITNMKVVEKPSGNENTVTYKVRLAFDDSNPSAYVDIYKRGLDFGSKRCTESPCSVWFTYTKKAVAKDREIVCFASECNEYDGCIVTIEGLDD